jgi:hypothetical protein
MIVAVPAGVLTVRVKSSQGVAPLRMGSPSRPVSFGTRNGSAVHVMVGEVSLTLPLAGGLGRDEGQRTTGMIAAAIVCGLS